MHTIPEIIELLQALQDGRKLEGRGRRGRPAGSKSLPAVLRGFANGTQYRLAPETITVNGFEVPAPLQVAPEAGAWVWAPNPLLLGWVDKVIWTTTSEPFLRARLDRGLIYAAQAGAVARSKAMAGVQP